MIENWDEWMADHHIKIGGKSNDDGADEVHSGGSVSGSEVEVKVPDNAGKTGSGDIQESFGEG